MPLKETMPLLRIQVTLELDFAMKSKTETLDRRCFEKRCSVLGTKLRNGHKILHIKFQTLQNAEIVASVAIVWTGSSEQLKNWGQNCILRLCPGRY